MGGGVTFRVSLHERLKIINPSQNQVCRSNLISKKVTNIALIYILTFELKLLKSGLKRHTTNILGLIQSGNFSIRTLAILIYNVLVLYCSDLNTVL